LAFFPSIFSTYENDGERETKFLMKDLLSIFIIILVPAVAGMTVLARNIIAVILGAEFQNSYVVLGWITAGKFFGGLFPYYTKSFELKEKTIYLPFILLGPAILNIGLNILLIPYIGILGAAISTFVSYLACLILVSAFGSRFIKWIFPWSVLLKSVLASSIMVIVIQYLPDFNTHWITLLFKVLLGAILYLFIISVFERRVIKDGFHILKSRSV
jgi:O-antigen/teichoic acid export membrane protein